VSVARIVIDGPSFERLAEPAVSYAQRMIWKAGKEMVQRVIA